jgi:uncharacterized membrane protein
MEIFKHWGDIDGGLWFLAKYFHILMGITWIGLLYFFNVVQVPAYAELTAEARSEALRTVTWRALWWFRWAALMTFLTGVVMFGIAGDEYKWDNPRGSAIFMGALLAITMFLNVWGVIWRMQKVNIRSVTSVANGGPADPEAPLAAKRAARASRVNTLFSIPMLFFMVFAPHYSFRFDSPIDSGKAGGAWAILVVLWAFTEASALGFVGGLDNAFNKAVLDDHRNTILAGFVFLVIVYFIGWEAIIGS